MNESKPTHLDLFSGIGGFSLAFEAEGFETIGFSEIDPYASAVLRKHWPHVVNYGDVRNVTNVHADVLTGGPPCQPASTAGKRLGAKDDRWLWPETLQVVDSCRPKVCLFENPLGFTSLNGGMELDQVLSSLEAMDYKVPPPLVIPACAVDAAHPRLRVWIIAYINGSRKLQPQGFVQNKRGRNLHTSFQSRAIADVNSPRLERSITAKTSEADTGNRAITKKSQLRFDPSLLRSIHGVSDRMDRIKCLGNSIVPQVAQVFARAIRQLI